jgi:hypothetical protein
MRGVQERLDPSAGGGAKIVCPPTERGERGSLAIIGLAVGGLAVGGG